MKKAISILAAAMMLSCTFVSCGSSKDDDKSEGIVGKWSANEDTLKGIMEDDEGTALSAVVEFRSDNKMTLTVEGDYSDVIQVKDDSINWAGTKMEYTYDGKTININAGALIFERTGDADTSTVYGEYRSDTFDSEAGNYLFRFESADRTVTVYSAEGTYEYNEEEGTLTTSLDDEGDEPSKVEIDGDTLKVTDKEGTETYTRVK